MFINLHSSSVQSQHNTPSSFYKKNQMFKGKRKKEKSRIWTAVAQRKHKTQLVYYLLSFMVPTNVFQLAELLYKEA